MTRISNTPYSALEVGQKASYEKTVDERDIQLFAAMSGDRNPVHLDADYAAGTLFKERIAHGMFSGALISAAVACTLPGPGTIYLGQTMKFTRPVKLGDTLVVRLEILEKLGATVSREDGLTLRLARRFRGARHWPDYMSVTATENFVMAAALARGTSTLINAASEPHVQDLCRVLAGMGARIDGIGTSQLVVEGVDRLRGGTFTISTDHHEVVTFLALGAITSSGAVRRPAATSASE